MNNYFNGHELNTGFSIECPGEKKLSKQSQKSTETARLWKISSPANYVEKLVFFTIESPDKSKLLINRH